MTNALMRIYGAFCFLFLCMQWTAINSTEESDKIVNLQNNVPRAKFGEICWNKICEENLICNEDFICQCRSGLQIYNNEYVSITGENEPCEKSEDCCGELLCINGFCKKLVPNKEFITIAKICLGITVTTIVLAVFCSLIKCLYRYDTSRAFHRNNSSLNSMFSFSRQALHPGPLPLEVLDEKPPSYEECIRSTGGNPLVEPPPYTISTNADVTSTTETRPVFQFTNVPAVNTQNLTALSVQSLNHDVNSNAIVTESLEKENAQVSANSLDKKN